MRRRKTLPKKAGWYWFDRTRCTKTEWRPVKVYREAYWGLVVESESGGFSHISSFHPSRFGSKIKK